MNTRVWITAVGCLMVAGCSSSGGLTTGSLIGAGAKKNATSAPAVAPVIQSTPTERAFHVGANSARAIRCGFNFDAARLKSNFMASETAAGLQVADMAKVGSAYSTGFNGVTKGIGDAKQYCTDKKVAAIKVAITRYLAGDFSVPKKKIKVAKKKDTGGFWSFFEADEEDKGPSFGSDDWWAEQNAKSGN